HADKLSFTCGAMLRMDPRRVTVDVAGERLLPAVDHLHRATRVQREHCRVDLDREILAAAEGAADSREVDAHLLLREAQTRCDLLTVDVQPLRRDVDVDAALAVGTRKDALRPDE